MIFKILVGIYLKMKLTKDLKIFLQDVNQMKIVNVIQIVNNCVSLVQFVQNSCSKLMIKQVMMKLIMKKLKISKKVHGKPDQFVMQLTVRLLIILLCTWKMKLQLFGDKYSAQVYMISLLLDH